MAADGDEAGLLLARLSAAPVLAATAFLLAGFPLLALGWFRPAPVAVLAGIAAAVIVPIGLRALPGLRPGAAADPRRWAQPGDPAGGETRRTPLWSPVGVLLIAIGFLAFQSAYRSQFVIVTRDPGAYLQFAAWIAGHGGLPVTTSLAAFGGAKGLTFGGFAMYQVGSAVVPQFMAGLPMVLAAGFWLGGVNGALLLAPFLGAVAVVVFGGLAARLVGARWAPLAALVIAVSEPLMFTSRSPYSEPLALIVFLGGLSLVVDSLRAESGARVLALLAGLALGTSLLVRIDSPADALPVIPYLGQLLVRRQRQAVPLLLGLAIGWAPGWYDAIFVSFPYAFQTNRASTVPMIEIIAAALAVTTVACLWLRRRVRVTGRLPRVGGHWWLPDWLPALAATLPFTVLAGFGARSHFDPGYAADNFAQLSLHWVYWYLGGPALALAAAGAAALAYGCLRGRWPSWALPLMTFSWSILVFLDRPDITPDQPWASRRLVPAVLPGFILLAVWAVAWACGKVRDGNRRGLAAAVAACACALLVVPAALGAAGTALKRTYGGEVAAVEGLCARIPRDASVVIVDGPLADRIGQVVRGMCGVPVARYRDHKDVTRYPAAPTALVANAITSIERIGRTPVLLAATEQELAAFAGDGTVTQGMNLNTTTDGKFFLSGPDNVAPYSLSAWMWEPAGGS